MYAHVKYVVRRPKNEKLFHSPLAWSKILFAVRGVPPNQVEGCMVVVREGTHRRVFAKCDIERGRGEKLFYRTSPHCSHTHSPSFL